MEAVILIGLQASGKSTFWRRRFRDTHVRINLDMLRTRPREWAFVETCLATRQRFVVDNTNPTRADRQRYIAPAKAAGFRAIGYWFTADLDECRQRNRRRRDKEPIPDGGLRAALSRMEPPTLAEGFDELHTVTIAPDGSFAVCRCPPTGEAK
jgi:predicted kinase